MDRILLREEKLHLWGKICQAVNQRLCIFAYYWATSVLHNEPVFVFVNINQNGNICNYQPQAFPYNVCRRGTFIPKNIDESTTCPVCWEEPGTAYISSCGHLICETCIYRLVPITYPSSTFKDNEVTCPMCRSQVSTFCPFLNDSQNIRDI